MDHFQERTGQSLERRVLVCDDRSVQTPRVLLREETLGDADKEINVEGDGSEKNEQGDERIAEDNVESTAVGVRNPLEELFAEAVEAAVLFFVLQEVRAHHGGGAQRNHHGDHDGDRKRNGELAEE